MSTKFGATQPEYIRIHETVQVKPFTVIGMSGFGFETKAGSSEYKIPLKRKQHKFGVIIEENVEIGACCCIDRGSWRDSIIGKGSKLDNMVHTGHNTQIGEYCLIAVGTTIGGSCTIGNRCFLGMNCMIKQGVKIADRTTIGMGAVVTKDIIEEGTTWVGNPARKLK